MSRFLLVSNVYFSPGCVNPFHTNFKQYIPLAAKDLSISFGSKNPNISLNTCTCSIETLLTWDIGTQTACKCNSKSSTLLPAYEKIFLVAMGIESATYVLNHNISVTLPCFILNSNYTPISTLKQIRNCYDGRVTLVRKIQNIELCMPYQY